MAKKRGRKRKNDLYFGPEQEQAVCDYLSIGVTLELTGSTGKPYYIWSGTTTERRQRDKIFVQHLHEPLIKMVESIIRRYKLYRKGYTFEDLHADALSFLMMKSYKFDIHAGKRAYSYYGTIIKNYLLGMVQKDDKSMKKFASYEENYEQINDRDDLSYDLELEDEGLLQLIMEVTDKIEDELKLDEEADFTILNDNQRKVGHALIEILLNWDKVLDDVDASDNKKYDKLAIYEAMRNLTGLNTKEMRKGLTHFKSVYFFFKDDYIDNDLL
ncbi:MAG: hypothetical protein ACW98D_17195 [Promethearchaeota archaeon]|jgi:DNA-directed RNA polymerase specialized sigma subunit